MSKRVVSNKSILRSPITGIGSSSDTPGVPLTQAGAEESLRGTSEENEQTQLVALKPAVCSN